VHAHGLLHEQREHNMLGKMIGLALFTAMAVNAIACAAASASNPAVWRCRKVAVGTGIYDDSECLVAQGGAMEYIREQITGATFTTKDVGTSTVTAVSSGTKVECTAATGGGVITSASEGRSTIKFTGCTSEPGGSKCNTAGAGTGEIVEPTSAKVVDYTEGSTVKAGWLVIPRNASGADELNFTCAGVSVKLMGSAIGSVSTELETSSLTVKWLPNKTETENAIPDVIPLEIKVGSGGLEKATVRTEALLTLSLAADVMY
jgi:hypothetical protein